MGQGTKRFRPEERFSYYIATHIRENNKLKPSEGEVHKILYFLVLVSIYSALFYTVLGGGSHGFAIGDMPLPCSQYSISSECSLADGRQLLLLEVGQNKLRRPVPVSSPASWRAGVLSCCFVLPFLSLLLTPSFTGTPIFCNICVWGWIRISTSTYLSHV